MINYKSKYLKYKLKYKKYGGMQHNNQEELISKDDIFEILQNRHNVKQLRDFINNHPEMNENKIDYIIDKFINLKQHIGLQNVKEVVNDVKFENMNKTKLDHILIRQYITNKINYYFNNIPNSEYEEIKFIINIIKNLKLDIFKQEDIEVINFFKQQVNKLQLTFYQKNIILQDLNNSYYEYEIDPEKVYFLSKILNEKTNDKLQEEYIKLLEDNNNSRYLLMGHGSSLENLFVVPDNIIIITTSPNNFVCKSNPESNKVHCNKNFNKLEDFYKYNLSIDKSRIYYPGQIMRNMIFIFKNTWSNPFRYCHGGLISEKYYNNNIEQKYTSFINDEELIEQVTEFHDYNLYSRRNQGFKEINKKHKFNYSDELSNIIYNISYNLKFNLQEKNKKIILFLKSCRTSNNNDVPIECNIEQMDTISNRTLKLEPELKLSRALSFSSNVTDLNLKRDFNTFLNNTRLTHYDENIRKNLYTPIQNHISYINFINTNDKNLLNNNNKFTFSLEELCNFYKFLNLKEEEELNGTTEKRLNDDKKQEKIRQKKEKYKLKEIEDKIKYKSCKCNKRALLRIQDYLNDGKWTEKDIEEFGSIICCERHQENLLTLDYTGKNNTFTSRDFNSYRRNTVLENEPDLDGKEQKQDTEKKRSRKYSKKTKPNNNITRNNKNKNNIKNNNKTSRKRNSGKKNKTLTRI